MVLVLQPMSYRVLGPMGPRGPGGPPPRAPRAQGPKVPWGCGGRSPRFLWGEGAKAPGGLFGPPNMFLASISTNKEIIGETFNLGTGRNHSVMDIVRLVDGPHVHIPERPGEARETLADNSKAVNLLGWNPSVVFEEWVEANRPK